MSFLLLCLRLALLCSVIDGVSALLGAPLGVVRSLVASLALDFYLMLSVSLHCHTALCLYERRLLRQSGGDIVA